MTFDQTAITTHEGTVSDGTKYLIQVPVNWNGDLLLYSYGPPRPPEAPAWDMAQPMVSELARRGYAVAGCGTTVFWPIKENLPNQIAIADLFDQLVAPPERTIALGQSIGGLMTAALVQYAPERLDGGLVVCGTLGGGIATHNQQLDCTFAFKTLLGAGSGLDLVRIADAPANLELALTILEAAQATPQGRARIALAAAMANIPGWFNPSEPEPAADDIRTRQRNQYLWLREIDWHVFLEARAVLEHRGQGNLSWNTNVNYREVLAHSIDSAQVAALYREACLDLDEDLDTLARAPRIDADPSAVTYFEQHITFNGKLSDVPVVTLHSLGDGLVPVDHIGSYGDVVTWAGDRELLRQVYTARGGHCSFTTAEFLTVFDRLVERIESGSWPDFTPDSLNGAATSLGLESNVLPPALGSWMPDQAGVPVPPAFVEFTPPVMVHGYDVRHAQ